MRDAPLTVGAGCHGRRLVVRAYPGVYPKKHHRAVDASDAQHVVYHHGRQNGPFCVVSTAVMRRYRAGLRRVRRISVSSLSKRGRWRASVGWHGPSGWSVLLPGDGEAVDPAGGDAASRVPITHRDLLCRSDPARLSAHCGSATVIAFCPGTLLSP